MKLQILIHLVNKSNFHQNRVKTYLKLVVEFYSFYSENDGLHAPKVTVVVRNKTLSRVPQGFYFNLFCVGDSGANLN